MASDQMVVAALGRPFSLGMLYDAHRDQLITGLTLWDKKTIEEHSKELPQQTSACDVTASDSLKSKTSLLDINASLKASFLSGLVEVGGSAKYLNDRKKSNKRTRLTFRYKATTFYKQLTMAHLVTANMEEMGGHEECSATHVVTDILYGANAFFVFDSEKLDVSSIQNIEGSMEAMVKKIPKLELEGKVGIKLSNEEKALTEKFSCSFYGDFLLEKNTLTFEDAVEMYRQLPKMLGERGEQSVPLKVWLTPLKSLIPTAPELKGDICISLLRKAENTLERMKQIEVRCSDCMEEKVVESFPQIFKSKLICFQKLCKDYTATLQHTMREKFPSIRAGEEDDSSVEKLFDDMEKSLFSHENLNKWLNSEERKLNVVKFCVESEGIERLPNHSELDQGHILNLQAENVLCLVFTSPETTDHFLDQMANFLHSHDLGRGRKVSPPTHDQSYFSDEAFNTMMEKGKVFHNLVKRLKFISRFRFLAAVKPNKKYKGATIYHYRETKLVTDSFSMPAIPDVTTVTDKQDLILYACELTLDPDTMNGYLSLSEGNKKVTCGSWQTYPYLPGRFGDQPQVLCKQELSGQHYWEVEWNEGGTYVGVGVTYRESERTNSTKFGSNKLSWFFGIDEVLCAYHDGWVWSKEQPPTWCKRVAVFLDCPRGTLSFYSVTQNKLTHLYTFYEKFYGPLYAGLHVYKSYAICALCTDL